jgi:ankyrin repeat protein
MYAASGPFADTVELLLSNGAQPNLTDTVESWTALMIAAAEGHRPVVETLLRHGADPTLADADGDTAADHARTRGQAEVAVFLDRWIDRPLDSR